MIGGLLTEIGWRWVFFLPAPVALVDAHRRASGSCRRTPRRARGRARSTSSGAVSMTAAMLLLVFTLVEAPDAGLALAPHARLVRSRSRRSWPRSWRASARAAAPLVRLGILRSGALVRANLGAMSLFGGWVGFQFVATLYLQQLRGWSALETGLAIFPAGLLVALALAADRAADRPLRRHAADRDRDGLDRGRLRPVPADRPRLELRCSGCCRRSCWPASASRSRSGR